MNTTFYSTASQNFMTQEQQIQTLQQEIGTGVAVPTAGTNPSNFVGAVRDASQISILGADNQNQTNLQARLGIATTTIQQTSTVLDSIQAIALQAINGTTSSQDYQALSEQIGSADQQLMSLANIQGVNDNYIFSGTTETTKPFVESGSGSVTYVGNDGSSSVEIAPGIQVNAALSGSVFTGSPSGNGFANVSASLSNTGTATLLAVGVTQQSAAQSFQQGSQPITISIGSSSGHPAYTAKQAGAVIGSGSAKSGAAIQLDGLNFQLAGSAVSGDSFTIAPSRPQSVFALAKTIQAALSSAGSTPAQMAQTRQVLGNALGAITAYQNRLAATNAKIGVVLKTITGASTANANMKIADQTNQSNLTAVDLPAALTSIDQQTSALQAALKAFSVAQGLSLFSYI